MRAFQRALRRAHLPVRLTRGFNPRPRLVLPVPIEVGVSSEDDVAEMELDEPVPEQELAGRLAAALPPGLRLRGVRSLPCRRRVRKVAEIVYRLEREAGGRRVEQEDVDVFLRAPSVPFERPPRRDEGIRRVDLRPCVADLRLEGSSLVVALQPSRGPIVRPREVLAALTGRTVEELADVEIVRLRVAMVEEA